MFDRFGLVETDPKFCPSDIFGSKFILIWEALIKVYFISSHLNVGEPDQRLCQSGMLLSEVIST